MGFLIHVFAAFAAIAAAEEGYLGTRLFGDAALPALFSQLVFLAAPFALARLARREALRGRFPRAALLARLVQWSPIALYPFVLGALGWHALATGVLGEGALLSSWPGPELLVVLAPWLALEVASIDARARMQARDPRTRIHLRVLQLRMLAGALLPVVAYLIVSGSVGRIEPLRVRIEEISLWSAGFSLVLLLMVALLLPTLLRVVWATRRFGEGEFVERLFQAVATRARFRCRGLYLWDTGGTMANAAIVGFGPAHRLVLVSDALLARLEPGEVAAVFAHEIAHAKKHHVLVFGLWTLAWFLGLELLLSSAVPAAEDASEAFGVVVETGGLFGGIALGALLFGFVSRRIELQADLYASKLLGTSAPMIGALEKVGGIERTRGGFRHFSTARRVGFLELVRSRPELGRRLERFLGAFAALGVIAFVVVAGLRTQALTAELPVERLRADLRLGRFERVIDEAAKLEDPGAARLRDELVRWRDEGELTRAGEPEFLEARAREALSQGEAERALAILELGGLRGDEALGAAAQALGRAFEGDEDGVRAALEDGAATSWQAAIRAVLNAR